MSFYAVRVGRVPGIYKTWDECQQNTKGFPKAEFKKFNTEDEAKAFINFQNVLDASIENLKKESKEPKLALPYAFVDGSFNPSTKVFGYGGFVVCNSKSDPLIVQGSGTDESLASMRNVAGEIHGAMAAINKAIELGLPEINIYYDYMGIEMWATGAWKCNKEGTIAYRDFINSVKDTIKINFIKVAAHTGIPGNEEADRLAKESVGL